VPPPVPWLSLLAMLAQSWVDCRERICIPRGKAGKPELSSGGKTVLPVRVRLRVPVSPARKSPMRTNIPSKSLLREVLFVTAIIHAGLPRWLMAMLYEVADPESGVPLPIVLPVMVPLIGPLPTMFMELLAARSRVLVLTLIDCMAVALPLLPRSMLTLLSWNVEFWRVMDDGALPLMVVRKPAAWLPEIRLLPLTVTLTVAVPVVTIATPLAPVPTGFGPIVEPVIVSIVRVPLLASRRMLSPFVPLIVVALIEHVPNRLSKRRPASFVPRLSRSLLVMVLLARTKLVTVLP
jgi:hypothetical protein